MSGATGADGSPPVHRFLLFIAGDSSRSARAAANLRALCGSVLPGSHEIEVVDVLERPDLAEASSVLATPLVIRVTPPPVRRAVGDFSDLARLASAIDLSLDTHDLGLPMNGNLDRKELR